MDVYMVRAKIEYNTSEYEVNANHNFSSIFVIQTEDRFVTEVIITISKVLTSRSVINCISIFVKFYSLCVKL